MNKQGLLDAAKLRVRKTAQDGLDNDVQRLIDTAITDLGRIGVHSTWLDNIEDPLLIEAVLAYVKANYGLNDNYDTLINVYNMVLTKIKGDAKYFDENPNPPEPEPEPEPDPEPEPEPDPTPEPDPGD